MHDEHEYGRHFAAIEIEHLGLPCLSGLSCQVPPCQDDQLSIGWTFCSAAIASFPNGRSDSPSEMCPNGQDPSKPAQKVRKDVENATRSSVAKLRYA